MKELLFNGAERQAKANFTLSGISPHMSSDTQSLTPLELLVHFEEVIEPREFITIRSFLLGASETICFQTRRPLQKVKRNNRFMCTVVLLYVVNIALSFFSALEVFAVQYCPEKDSCPPSGLQTDDSIIYLLKGLESLSIACMLIALVTYVMTNRMNPGFVSKSLNFIELLQIGNDRNIDLENFCFYCHLIKSTRTFHCMVCNRCVEKFDHHCVYINNCLGHRNHKYFMIFIVNITIYIIISSLSRVLAFFTIDLTGISDSVVDNPWRFLILGALIYTLTINAMVSVPLMF